MMAMQKPIQKDPFYSCQFGRKDLKQSGVSSLLLVVMKIDCSGPMSGISQVTQVLQITCHTINYPKYKISFKLQIKNSIHLICSSRWQFCCTNLLRNESNASWNTIVQEFPLRIVLERQLSKIKKLKILWNIIVQNLKLSVTFENNNPKFQHCQPCPQILPFDVILCFFGDKWKLFLGEDVS